MNIRHRLILLGLQISILLAATFFAVDVFVVNEIWFFSGLLAVIVTSNLLEPFYPKSFDILGNSIIAGFLAFISIKELPSSIWWVLISFFILLILLSTTQLLVHHNNIKNDSEKKYGVFAFLKLGKGVNLYSLIFIVSILLEFSIEKSAFWILGFSWLVVIASNTINWEQMFPSFYVKNIVAKPLGAIMPSQLIITSLSLPKIGTELIIKNGNTETEGVLIRRISRTDDLWGQIQLHNSSNIDWLVSRNQLSIEINHEASNTDFIGIVDEGTTVETLFFITNESSLSLGDTIYYKNSDGKKVLYQISSLQIINYNIRAGARLERLVNAVQIGVYDEALKRLVVFKELPKLNTAIYKVENNDFDQEYTDTDNHFSLGNIKNTKFQLFLNSQTSQDSHMAILGMTGMGKTTLVNHLIQHLAATRRVIVFDQAGEFVAKLGYTPYATDDALKTTGVSVRESTENPPKDILKFLKYLVNIAKQEYQDGLLKPRVIVIDEAHQFIPEPAMLGFGLPGRDESMQFGLLMMQVRKYGISIIFISQRTAVVSKSALSQCENLIAFKSVDQTGLDYLEAILGSQSRKLLPTLNRGEAIVFGPCIESDKSSIIKTRK
jgi:energy-coupling factor transporter ATP-binding protein EcfA2